MTLEEFTAQLNAITFWKEFTFSETRLGREKTISRPIHPFYAATLALATWARSLHTSRPACEDCADERRR
jgi:hypothetical protein